MKSVLFRNSLLILLLLWAGLTMAQTSVKPDGLGTAEEPYKVQTLDHLYWITQNSGSWDKYFIQTEHIDATSTSGWHSGSGFSPIGNTATPFTGSYNGQGGIITNLFIDRDDQDNVGMFGYIAGGTVENLGLIDADITGQDMVGALAGWIRGKETFIRRCFSGGSVTGNEIVGGLVGSNIILATIENSGSVASVVSDRYAGGLVGYNGAIINNCYASGTVTANTEGGGGLSAITATTANSFWDTETSGLAVSAGGTGKSTAEMKTLSTFTSTATDGLDSPWDFIGTPHDDTGILDYWNMHLTEAGTVNDGYPIPSWLPVYDEPAGSGTEGDPYLIATLNNLYWLSDGPGIAILPDGKYFKQTADIPAQSTENLHSGKGFSPIGTDASVFSGFYDGQEYVIDQLYINRPWQSNVALFGNVATIGFTNIGLTNGNVTGHYRTGMLIGNGNANGDSYMINCFGQGQVNGYNMTGGLIGYFEQDNSTAFLVNSHFSGFVYGHIETGGLVGQLWKGKFEMFQCYSESEITDAMGMGSAGGLIGLVNNDQGSVIRSSYATGKINGVTGDNLYGGLIGQPGPTSVTFENCYSRCDIIISGDAYYIYGGIAGADASNNYIHTYSAGVVPQSINPASGGFIGTGGSLIQGEACFWDEQVSGHSNGIGNVTPDPEWLSGKSTENMKLETTFTGWDFDNIWAIDPLKNDGYPYLQMNQPFVTTAEISDVGDNTALSGGKVVYEGSSPVTARGVVWDDTGNPSITSNLGITTDGTGTGTYTSTLTGLSPGTEYYVRAYATNGETTGYGTLKTFITLICNNPASGGVIAADPASVCAGPVSIDFSETEPVGTYTGTLEYVWQISTSSPTFEVIPGAVSRTFTYIGTITQTTWFRRLVKVTCEEEGWVESNVVEITVNSPPKFTANISKPISCQGADDGEITITVLSGQAPYSYRYSTDGGITWIGGDTEGWNIMAGDTVVLTGLGPATYTLELCDGNGCVQTECSVSPDP